MRTDSVNRNWRRDAVLVLLALVAYLPALDAGFVFDDRAYVTENPRLTSVSGLVSIWTEPAGSGYQHQYYPLTSTLLWATRQLSGLDPFGYHLINVLLHALNAVLLWRLLRRLGLDGAWLAAAIFAIHPVNVTSVAWVSELKNVLSTALVLASAHSLLRPLRLDVSSKDDEPTWKRSYALAVVLFAGALLSKTATSLLPAALLLIIYWKRGRVGRRDLSLVAPLFCVGLAMVALTVWLEATHGVKDPDTPLLLQRLLIAGGAIWFYAGKLIWPMDLMLIYPRWNVDPHDAWWYAGPVALGLLLTTLWLKRGVWGRGPLCAVVYFVVALAPVSLVTMAFTRFSFVADHWQYWASMGFFAAFAAGAMRLNGRVRHVRRWAPAAAATLLVTLTLMTSSRARVFERPVTLWSDNAARNETSWLVWFNLGASLASEGRLDDAIGCYQRSLACDGATAVVRSNLGLALRYRGQSEAALEQYRLALVMEPDAAFAENNLGELLDSMGQPTAAIEHYQRAAKLDPSSGIARHNLGMRLLDLGRYQEAIDAFWHAVHLDPDSSHSRVALGDALRGAGRLDDARHELEIAATRRPRDATLQGMLADVCMDLGDARAATQHALTAADLEPTDADHAARLAQILVRASQVTAVTDAP